MLSPLYFYPSQVARMVRRVRRAGRKWRLNKCTYYSFCELYEEILADMLTTDLDAWKEEILNGACSKNSPGSTAESAEDVVASRCSLTSEKSGSENDECVHLNSVLEDARSAMDETSHDSSIEEIVLVLDSSDESTMDGTLSNEENSSNSRDRSDVPHIPFLSDSVDNNIINIFEDDTDDEESIHDNYGKLEIDLDLTAEAIEMSATESTMLNERIEVTPGLPANANTFWNFMERLTNPQRDETVERLDSADGKSTLKVLSQQKTESTVSNLPCTKNAKENFARGTSISNGIVAQTKKCVSPPSKTSTDEKKQPTYGRFDEELAKLDEQVLFTAKSHKVGSAEKLPLKKNSPPTLNASTSVYTKKAIFTPKETVSVEKTRTTSDTKCNVTINKKYTNHESQNADKTRNKNSEGTGIIKNKLEIKESRKIDIARRKNVEDSIGTSRKQELPQLEKVDIIKKKSPSGVPDVSKKHQAPRNIDVTRKKNVDNATVTGKQEEIPQCEETNKIKKKNSEVGTASQKQEHVELKQNAVIKKKSSEAAVVISKKHESHEREKTDITRPKNSDTRTPELIADKVGSEICEPRTHSNPNHIKINFNIFPQYRKSDSTRAENYTSNAQQKSHSGNATINITETVLKEKSTMNVIHGSNKIQIAGSQISVDITTGVDIADCSETGKPPLLNCQRKRVQQIIETDCPLKKHKSYSLAAGDANDNARHKRKRLRNKLRKLFGDTNTISEEDEEDMLIQKNKRQRKHSIKSNDSGISVCGNNIASFVSNEVLKEIKSSAVYPLRKHSKHGLKKPLERLTQKENTIDKSMESKESEYIQKNVGIITELPQTDKNSALFETNEVAGFQDNTPVVIKPTVESTENNTCKNNSTEKQPESPKQHSKSDSSNECDLFVFSKSIRNTSTNSESSDVMPSTEIDKTLDPISEDDTTRSNVVSNDHELVSSSQNSTRLVSTGLHNNTRSSSLQEDFTELLEINMVEKVIAHYQVVTKGNMLSIVEIKDVNENIIKQKDSISTSVQSKAEERISPEKRTDQQNKSEEIAKHSAQSVEQKGRCRSPRDMPLLEELLTGNKHAIIEDSLTPTTKEDINIVSILEANQHSTTDGAQNSQSNAYSRKDIDEAPASTFGKLRVRTSEELGSRWCPTPALIPTPDTSAVSAVITSTTNRDSNTNANTSDPIIPAVPLLLHSSTTESSSKIPKTKNPSGIVTVTVHERKNKASNVNDLKAVDRRFHPRILSRKSVATPVCNPPHQKASAPPSYTHQTPAFSNKRSYRSKDSAPSQIANATSASGHSRCNTLITEAHSSSVQTDTNMLVAQSRSGTVTCSKQYPIYSTVTLSNNMPSMNVGIEPQQPIRTSTTSVPQGDLYKYALSNQQVQHNVQVNASMKGDFRIPVTMSIPTNPHSLFVQNNRVAQNTPLRVVSMTDRIHYPYQGPSPNGSQLGSPQHSLAVTPNAHTNVSLPSHIIGTTTYIPVISKANTPAVGQQVPNAARHQYNQQVPIVNMPSVHKQIPVIKQQAQVAFHQIPLVNYQYPNVNRQVLVTSNQVPIMKQIPVLNQQLPLFNPMLHQSSYQPVNQIIQQVNVAQPHSLNHMQQTIPVIAVTSHVLQTPSPTAQKTANVGEYGKQGLPLQNNEQSSKDLYISETSPQLPCIKHCQQNQSPTTVEVGPFPQKAEISNPPIVAAQPVATKNTKFEVLKKLRLEQQVQLVRQIDCYLINCFSLSQYMTKQQWDEVQSTKSVLMELKTVLDNHIKVLLQDYCYEPTSDTDTPTTTNKLVKTKAEDRIPSHETSIIESKQNSEEEKLMDKTRDSNASDETNYTQSKPNSTGGGMEEKQVENGGTASTKETESPNEIKNLSNLSDVTRTNAEEMEILRNMYREWCEPEDSATNDSEGSQVNTSEPQVSADSHQSTIETDDSAVGKTTVNSNKMETINSCTTNAVSPNNDKDMKGNNRTNQLSTDNDENTTSSIEIISLATFADDQQLETNTKAAISKMRTHSSESSLIANTPEDLSDIEEKTTISNADIEPCTKDTRETDCECIDDIKSEAADISEDSESMSEHLECISNHDETTCTSILSLSDHDSSSFETSGEIKEEDIDNLSQSLAMTAAPPSPEIAIASIASISIDTFDTLDKNVANEPIVIDGDDIEEMCESKSCLQCGEPSVVVCGGCLEAQYCLTHCSDSTWTDHCKECRSLNADVTCD